MFGCRCCSACDFFFFKQKTAYEMRISDWSSDVCSSDLFADPGGGGAAHRAQRHFRPGAGERGEAARRHRHHGGAGQGGAGGGGRADRKAVLERGGRRSEEHTSELQSLMRISYAVFCLKKKKKTE